jgi:hypothetical protein
MPLPRRWLTGVGLWSPLPEGEGISARIRVKRPDAVQFPPLEKGGEGGFIAWRPKKSPRPPFHKGGTYEGILLNLAPMPGEGKGAGAVSCEPPHPVPFPAREGENPGGTDA